MAKFLVCVETINPKNNVCLEGCYQKLDVVTFPVSEEEEAKKRLDLLRPPQAEDWGFLGSTPMRSSKYAMKARVLGGFPVIVGFSITPDDPSVGYRGGVEDVEFFHHKTGRPLGSWIDKRMDETPGEWKRLHD